MVLCSVTVLALWHCSVATETASEPLSNFAHAGDKYRISLTGPKTLSGNLLHFKIHYESETERCHPTNQ